MIELLTVMAIMFIIMAMTMVAFRGLVRSFGLEGVVTNMRETLSLARQHAITHRTRVYVIFDQGPTNQGSYVICAQSGVHSTEAGPDYLVVNAPLWKPGELVKGIVYNLSDGSWAEITQNGTNWVVGTLTGGANNKWYGNNRYGWAIHDVEFLPPTLRFNNTENPNDKPENIVFLPDGTTEKGGTQELYDVKVKETVGGVGAAERAVQVRCLTGLVE